MILVVLFGFLVQMPSSRGGLTMPHDSTYGVPDKVFIAFWIVLIVFTVRILWEFRHKVFKRK